MDRHSMDHCCRRSLGHVRLAGANLWLVRSAYRRGVLSACAVMRPGLREDFVALSGNCRNRDARAVPCVLYRYHCGTIMCVLERVVRWLDIRGCYGGISEESDP